VCFAVESDFYTTAAGRAHFSNQLQSIRYCVQEVRSGALNCLITLIIDANH